MGPDVRGGYGVAAASLVVFLVGVFAHVDSLTYWFASSDTLSLVESSRVTAWSDLVAAFTEPMMAGTRFVEFALFYRPLATLSYAVDYRLWGLEPTGYHLTNVLLHGTAGAAATVALTTVTRRQGAGFLGGLLFVAHPLTAEVVPAAGRRHDVMVTILLVAALTLFVRARETQGGREALLGSLVLYLLALLAKEPALVFPGLVVAWVVLQDDRPWSTEALWTAARAVAPFAALTALYLGVRVAVLGGLGGYKGRPPPTAGDAVMIVVEYLLSLGYPQGVVGVGTLSGAGIGWHLLVAGMGAVAVAVLVAAGRTLRDRGLAAPSRAGSVAPSLAALACAAALVAVPIALALEPLLVRRLPLLYDYGRPSIVTAYPRPSSPVVGLLLVGAVPTAAVWAATARSSPLRRTDAAALLFFGTWLVGPLALFVLSGDYTVRSGYASLVPAAGAVGLLLAVGVDALRATSGGALAGWPRDSATAPADLALVGVALLLVVPLAATSPLVQDYGGWETSGRVNEATLTGVQEAVEGSPAGTPVRVEGMVRIVADRGCAFPQAKSVQFARPGTVEAWLRLHGEQRRVSADDDRVLHGAPTRVTVAEGRGNGVVVVAVSYEGTDESGCLRTPWDRQ